jgi:hypothetical protein
MTSKLRPEATDGWQVTRRTVIKGVGQPKAGVSKFAPAEWTPIVIGSLAGGLTLEEIQREYDLTVDDIERRSDSSASLPSRGLFTLFPVLSN